MTEFHALELSLRDLGVRQNAKLKTHGYQEVVEENFATNSSWKEELRIVHYWLNNLRTQAPKLTHEFVTSTHSFHVSLCYC